MSDYTIAQLTQSLQKDNQRLNAFVSETMGVETEENESFTSLIQKVEENYSGGGSDEESLRLYKAMIEHNTDVLNQLTELPDGIIAIRDYAFQNCSEMNIDAIPEGVQYIGSQAFYNCSELALTSLPDSVTSIGDYAFRDCSSLALTELPKGVTSIGQHTFASCGITTIRSETLLEAGWYSFANRNLQEVYFPSVTTVNNTFVQCTKLSKVTLGALTSTSSNVFYECNALKELTIGQGTTASLYLQYCSKLTQESVHGIIENLADMTGKTAPKLSLHTLCTPVDKTHFDMINAKNWEHNCTLEYVLPDPDDEVEED